MGSIAHNVTMTNIGYIYRATSGGTVFSANEAGNTAFDYFDDSAVVDDAVYFAPNSTMSWSDLTLNIGTPMAGSDIVLVWEYYCYNVGWRTMHDLTDNTVNFTATGAVRVVFPLQSGFHYTTINGANKSWIRCRIDSLTSITEGGANVTSIAQYSDGNIDINGYTDGSPCTWTDVYDWIVANAPHIGASKWGTGTFKFDGCRFNIASRLRSTNENIFMGNGYYAGGITVSYLHSGTLSGDDGWVNGSNYFFCFRYSTQIIGETSNTMIFGGEWSYFTNTVDGISTAASGIYFDPGAGEWRGVSLNSTCTGYLGNSSTVDRCVFKAPIIQTVNLTSAPTKLGISNEARTILDLYGNSISFEDLSYTLPTQSVIYFASNYNRQADKSRKMINPVPALPDQTSAPRLVSRYMGLYYNLKNLFYYDDSAVTYTDYTSASSSATEDDIPLSGDVDDCYYFLANTTTYQSGFGMNPSVNFTINAQDNDYEYVWEHYVTYLGGWSEASAVWDTTNNFTVSGKVYLALEGGSSSWASQTINSVSGYWFRLRITSKGTDTPVASIITCSGQGGIYDCPVEEQYTCLFKIVDSNGDPIEGATVDIVNNNEESINLETDEDGLIDSTNITVTSTAFDPEASDGDYNYTKTDMNPFTLTISKQGFETYESVLTIDKKIDATFTLKTAIDIMTSNKGPVIRLDPTNSTNDRDIIILP